MKKWIVKYETYSKNVFVCEITGFDKQSAIETLLNCKEIYWIERLKSDDMKDTYTKEEVRLLMINVSSSILKNFHIPTGLAMNVSTEMVDKILSSTEVEAELNKLL